MITSEQRYQSIYGLMLGVAIGDALAQPAASRSRKAAIRAFGRKRLRYRMWPGQGLYSDDTQLALMTGQAVLQSRSQSNIFHRQFTRRLKWYAISLPVGICQATLLAGLKSWISWAGVTPGCWSSVSSPATRSLFLGVVLHNTGHRYLIWARDCAGLTHRQPVVTDGAAVLATASQIAAVSSSGRLNEFGALETLIKTAKDDDLKEALAELEPFLKRNSPPKTVATHFGWDHGISKEMLPTTIMAIYCFLRSPQDFPRAVRSALLIAGSNDTLVAAVGGLVGAHVGAGGLPEDLVRGIGDWPHDRSWMEQLARRLSSWPHGVDDLLLAPSLRSYPLSQFLRNLFRWPLVLAHKLVRMFGC